MRATVIVAAIFLSFPVVVSAQTASSGTSTTTGTQSPSSSTQSPSTATQSPSTGTQTSPQTGQGTSGSTATQTQQGGGQAAAATEPQPVPYSPTEFPLWLQKLRRAEVITVGAFPITLLFSSLGYQLMRYAENGFSQSYAPSLLGTGSTPLTNQEKIGVLIGGAALAAVVAVIDFGLGQRAQSK